MSCSSIFDGKTVQIQGDTASSTSLVETLEASPLFKDVGFKSQLTKLQGTPYDRFHISATLEAAPKPAPPPAAPDADRHDCRSGFAARTSHHADDG